MWCGGVTSWSLGPYLSSTRSMSAASSTRPPQGAWMNRKMLDPTVCRPSRWPPASPGRSCSWRPTITSSNAGDLVRDVVDAGPVRPVAQQQLVLVGVAGGAHEHAHRAGPRRWAEAEPVDVEGDGLLPPGLGDVQRDVAQAQRPDPAGWLRGWFHRVTAPVRLRPGWSVPAVEGLADGQPDAEAGLVDGVHLTVGALDLPVGGQGGGQLDQGLGGVDPPDDLAQGRPSSRGGGRPGSSAGLSSTTCPRRVWKRIPGRPRPGAPARSLQRTEHTRRGWGRRRRPVPRA